MPQSHHHPGDDNAYRSDHGEKNAATVIQSSHPKTYCSPRDVPCDEAADNGADTDVHLYDAHMA